MLPKLLHESGSRGTQRGMSNIIQRLLNISTYRHLDRRLAADTSLRRAVLASGVALSVACYVLAITAAR
ncbi:MAG: hypothetical protein LW596_06715 [Ilumatobacteraceae bacterium]|nr:hypothetical protein [Ilumatobacteraceae bacterium]